MHTGTHYKLSESLYWTRREIYLILAFNGAAVLLYQIFDLTWMATPWVPVALVGTAAAFIVSFKNTQTYNRLWEARTIWGAIVNSSRSWGMMTRDFIHSDHVTHQQLVYRHIAWLSALRYQLRKPQLWESSSKPHNVEYRRFYAVPEWDGNLNDELKSLLGSEELEYLQSTTNNAAQIIALQSAHLLQLKKDGCIEPFEYVELERRLADLYDQQGKCERIKNFPYPRQFASINLYFIWLFVIMLPFGMLTEFQKLGDHMIWLTIPFSTLVSWVYITMEKVGESTENPFQGGANDVPVTALSRSIEIDLREMLRESERLEALKPVNNILM